MTSWARAKRGNPTTDPVCSRKPRLRRGATNPRVRLNRSRPRACLSTAVAAGTGSTRRSGFSRLLPSAPPMTPRARAALVAMLATAVTATACADAPAPGPCIGSACGSQTTIRGVIPQGFNRKVDLLFVVDDTDAVAPWIENLRAGYPAMARFLENLAWGVPNLHVGFVRASRCASQTRARDCGIAAPEDFIRHEPCGSVSNFAGSFADAFACMADLGTQTSCAVAQPLAGAARRAERRRPRAGKRSCARTPSCTSSSSLAVTTRPASASRSWPPPCAR